MPAIKASVKSVGIEVEENTNPLWSCRSAYVERYSTLHAAFARATSRCCRQIRTGGGRFRQGKVGLRLARLTQICPEANPPA